MVPDLSGVGTSCFHSRWSCFEAQTKCFGDLWLDQQVVVPGIAPTFVAFDQEWRHAPPLPSIGDIRRELVSNLIWFWKKPLPDMPHPRLPHQQLGLGSDGSIRIG